MGRLRTSETESRERWGAEGSNRDGDPHLRDDELGRAKRTTAALRGPEPLLLCVEVAREVEPTWRCHVAEVVPNRTHLSSHITVYLSHQSIQAVERSDGRKKTGDVADSFVKNWSRVSL
jgi:hypothetical protein